MIYYEYKLILMDPFHIDVNAVENILSEHGYEGFRFVSIQKLWTSDKSGGLAQADYILLEKAEEQEDFD